MPTSILLADDHGIVLDGLRSVLAENNQLTVTATASTGQEALQLLQQHPIQLLITDYCMPDMDGLILVKKAKAQFPQLKIIVLSMVDEAGAIREILLAGADGYILKKYASQELFQGIEAVLNHHQYWSEEAGKALLQAGSREQGSASLTIRELEILRLLTQELTSKEIAQQLFISERTVETHRKNLLRKTGCTGTVGLVKYAYAHKLL
ncbi:MAG: response regulator transcription factor [Candidatus Pseudobacter hemicellulosilyticus]|uniref:Response regulator transcription factor n=1 Tax=Candidatus Pseudobacter hemicellulosilyticus TaxID=3121375 RepID=A0AAJ6BFF8_9BACT|nr:MAG: response regulator transcription factor [Pseudobacter sp.]